MDTSWGLIGTNLAFSCTSCFFGIVGFLTSFLGIRACTHKGFDDYNDIIVTSMGHHHHQRKFFRRRNPRVPPTGYIPPPIGTNLGYRPMRNISPPPIFTRGMNAPPPYYSLRQNQSVNAPLKSMRA